MKAILDIDLPETCVTCPLTNNDYDCPILCEKVGEFNGKRHPKCPLIPDTGKTGWFKLLSDGSISYETTPKGYGSKVQCRIIPIRTIPEPKRCPKCGQIITGGEEK